jgi:hypothetical protein
MDATPLCNLVDCTVQYATDEGILPPTPGDMFTVEELVGHLRAAAARLPHKLNMNLPNQLRATIHIGGPLAAITLHHLYFGRPPIPPGHPPTLYARPERPLTTGCVAFLTAGSTAEDDVNAERLLPVEDVIRIAAHLAAARVLPSGCEWVDGRGDQYCPDEAGELPLRRSPRGTGDDIPF